MRSTIWVSGISVRKKHRKEQPKRKYALLTTDLRNAVAYKKIIWAESQLRTLINRAGFN